MITVSVIDQASPELRALSARVSNPIPGLKVAGRAVANLLRAHYRRKDQTEPNKLGGRRTHYWRAVAHSVHNPVQSGAQQVTVSINDPTIGHKIMGGRITAKRAKMLTIPVRAEAHGRYAAVLERALGINLFLVKKGSKAFLAGRTQNKGKTGALRIFYVLKRWVDQRADPTALVPEPQMRATATAYFGRWVMRNTRSTGTT